MLFGRITSGAVLATVEAAFDLDYDIVVVKDCCADADAELHPALVEQHFPRIATVMTASELVTLTMRTVEP